MEPGSAISLYNRLVDKFLVLTRWPTARKVAVSGMLAYPICLLFYGIIVYSQARGWGRGVLELGLLEQLSRLWILTPPVITIAAFNEDRRIGQASRGLDQAKEAIARSESLAVLGSLTGRPAASVGPPAKAAGDALDRLDRELAGLGLYLVHELTRISNGRGEIGPAGGGTAVTLTFASI